MREVRRRARIDTGGPRRGRVVVRRWRAIVWRSSGGSRSRVGGVVTLSVDIGEVVEAT